jgi:F-type H+-transporting ATPase subunit delta
MSIKAINKRYAQALLMEAERMQVETTVEQDFVVVRKTLDSSPDLRMLFRSPIIEGWRKQRIAEEVFKGIISDLTLKFLLLVIEKGRERYAGSIVEAFGDLLDAKRNILRVGVKSAAALETESQQHLEQALRNRTGKDVRSDYTTDPSLIGGIAVTIGDTVIDGSLRRRLVELKDKLANN